MKKLILILSFIALNVHAVNCLEFLRSAYLENGLNNNYRIDSSYAPSLITDGKVYYSSSKYYYTDNSLDSTVECYNRGKCNTEKVKQIRETTDSAIKLSITNPDHSDSEVIIIYLGKDSTLRYNYGLNSGDPNELEMITSFFLHNDTLYVERKNLDGTPYENPDESSSIFENTLITPSPENENTCNAIDYTIQKKGDSYTKSFHKTHQEFIETTETGFTVSYSNYDAKNFFVKVGPNSTTSFLRKNRPAFIPEKAKHFDLLGRPANRKYIISVPHGTF